MSANENSGQPPLERQLRASLAWCAWGGVPVAAVMPAGLSETRVVELRDERAKESRR